MAHWLGRFESPLPIRCRGSFHAYLTHEVASGEPRTVIIPAPHASVDAARERLDRYGAAHARLSGEGLPPVAESAPRAEQPFVAFAIDAPWDGETVMARLGESGMRVSYAEAAGFVDRVSSTLERAHAILDPHTDRPFALGHICWSNILIARDGSAYVHGFGHNIAALTERDTISGAPSVYLAPEVGAGGLPSPGGDLYAFTLLQRSVLSYAELPSSLDRVFRGVPEPGDEVVARVIATMNARVIGASPSERATMTEARAVWREEWAAAAIVPDVRALAERLANLVALDEQAIGGTMHEREGELVIGKDGMWLRGPTGETHSLATRGPLRRVLLRLARAHREQPGQRLEADALLEAGWPGERPIREAGLNRVYVAVSTLRKMGLRDVLLRDEQGYRITDEIVIREEA